MRGKARSWRLETLVVVEKTFMDQQFIWTHCRIHLIIFKIFAPVELDCQIPYTSQTTLKILLKSIGKSELGRR